MLFISIVHLKQVIKLSKQVLILNSTIIFLFFGSILSGKDGFKLNTAPQVSIAEAREMRLQNPDSSVYLLESIYKQSLSSADTLRAVQSLTALAWVYGHQARYKESYDRLWAALLLADAAALDLQKTSVYRAIGRYYSFYHREENALKFLRLSLDLKKDLVARNVVDKSGLVENYTAICATYRDLNKPHLAEVYLDSARQYYDTVLGEDQFHFMEFEAAILQHNKKRYREALVLFEQLKPWFQDNKPSFFVLFLSFMGDTYKALGNFTQSERSYKDALMYSQKYHSHVDFTPLVHERLSQQYFEEGRFEEAYESLKTTKELDAIFFDSRSQHNLPLLEIQDAYREEKETQEKLLQQQRLTQLEQEERVMFLQRVILIVCIVFLLLFGLLAFSYVRNKHRSEKQIIERQRELEIRKSDELLELKNKELAASALKLIEKETLINTLKSKLSKGNGDIKPHEIRQIVRVISNNNEAHWKEFEARFVAVNRSFYDRLSSTFPRLTERDKKLCALLKLNFSSKEMAKLLGMSIESVHTTRYRLRKKLNLNRKINLTEFIANV